MRIQMTREQVTLAKVGVASLCIGAGLGYLVARRRFDRDVDTVIKFRDIIDEAEAEDWSEIPFTHENVRIGTVTKVVDTDDGINVEGIITDPEVKSFLAPDLTGISIKDDPRRLGEEFAESVTKATEPQRRPLHEATHTPELDEPERKNIWREPEWDVAEEMANRTTDAPYTLHANEYHNRETGYVQTTLYWYTDRILADENHAIIYNVGDVTGKLEFGRGSGDPDMVYIRNDKLRGEYEVVRVNDSYEHTVYGAQAEEKAEQDDLRHSSTVRRFRVVD